MINTDLHIFFMFYTQSTKIVTSNQQISREQNQKHLYSADSEVWQSRKQKKQNLAPHTTKQIRSSKIKIANEDSLSIKDKNDLKKQTISIFQINNQTMKQQQENQALQREWVNDQKEPNLDQTMQFKKLQFRNKEVQQNNQGPFFYRIKNAFSKHLMSSFSPSNFLDEIFKNKYDTLDQTSFVADETVNDLSINSLVQSNQKQALLVRSKRKQLQNSILYLQKDQYQN